MEMLAQHLIRAIGVPSFPQQRHQGKELRIGNEKDGIGSGDEVVGFFYLSDDPASSPKSKEQT